MSIRQIRRQAKTWYVEVLKAVLREELEESDHCLTRSV